MSVVDLLRVDLNLLVSLQVLLEERSVTRAARRCGVTQSSMSHALARLREVFDDPLLVRDGRGMAPTPRSEALVGALADALAGVQRVFQGGGGFDPTTATRRFSLICPDVLAAFLPDVLEAVTGCAPGVRLVIRLPRGDTARRLLDGDGDLALAPDLPDVPGLRRQTLGSIHWVVFARASHPALGRRLSCKAWVQYPHVVVSTDDGSVGRLGRILEQQGVEREIGLVVPTFLLAPAAVARTDYFFAGPRELLEPLTAPLGLTHRPLPISTPPVAVSMYWTERLHADPGHRWLRERVGEIARGVLRSAHPRTSTRRPR